MAPVLFIVNIPTEAEETRLFTEFVQKDVEMRNLRVEASFTETFTPLPHLKTKYEGPTQSHTIYLNAASSGAFNGDAGGIPCSSTSIKRITTNSKIQFERRTPLEFKTSELPAGNSNSSMYRENLDSLNQARDPNLPWETFPDFINLQKRRLRRKESTPTSLDLPNDAPMATVMREILNKYNLVGIWTKDIEDRIYQIMFTIESDDIYEKVLEVLKEWGIGERENSSMTVTNCVVSKSYSRRMDDDLDEVSKMKLNAQKRGIWSTFMNSVRSRLNVAEVLRRVHADAAITFDFLVMLVSAAILASFGLFEDSAIFLASSMLISPLMGPIIAAVFGTVIKDRKLCVLGIKNELIGVFISTLVGFIFGLIICLFGEEFVNTHAITTEMAARCDFHSLLVGIFTAIPSGAAVAIGILGGNLGSLVGVAISASLLPPAVNTGLLWAFGCAYTIWHPAGDTAHLIVNNCNFSNHQGIELGILGALSLSLTFANIICIYTVGIFVLRIKEIAPVYVSNNTQFWQKDIKIAREIGSADVNPDNALITEYNKIPQEDKKTLGLDCNKLRQFNLNERLNQNTWSPMYSDNFWESFEPPKRKVYSTVHRLESKDYYKASRRRNDISHSLKGFSINLSDELQSCSVHDQQINSSDTDTTLGDINWSKRSRFTITPANKSPPNDTVNSNLYQ